MGWFLLVDIPLHSVGKEWSIYALGQGFSITIIQICGLEELVTFEFSNQLVHGIPPFLLQKKNTLILPHILTIMHRSVKAFLLHMASHIQS